MKAKIKEKYSKHGILYVGILTTESITLSSRNFTEYDDAESWLTDRIKSEIDRKITKDDEVTSATKKM